MDASIGGTDIGISYQSGDGTRTHIYSISTVIREGETVDIDYSGRANGLEDANGNDLLSISSMSVTNLSEDLYSDIVFWDGFEGTITDDTYEATNYDYPAFHTGVCGNSTSFSLSTTYKKAGDHSLYLNALTSTGNMVMALGSSVSAKKGRFGFWWRNTSTANNGVLLTIGPDADILSSDIHFAIARSSSTTIRLYARQKNISGTSYTEGSGTDFTIPGGVDNVWHFYELSWDNDNKIELFSDGVSTGAFTNILYDWIGDFTHCMIGRKLYVTNTSGYMDNLIVTTDPNRDLYALSLLEAYPG